MRHTLAYIFTILVFASCVSSYQIKTGQDAYDLRQYAKAIPLFTQEFDSVNDKDQKGRLAFLLAKSYERLNDDTNSLKWYEKAIQYDLGTDVYKNLADAYKRNELYDRAIKTYQIWEQEGGSFQESRLQIDICEKAKLWKVADKSIVVEQLKLNSPAAEYAPVLYDGTYIVFSSDRPGSTGNSIYEWTGSQFSDLYISSKNGADPILFDDIINTEHNEGVACFNKDFTEIIFTRCYTEIGDDYCRLMWSIREGSGWSEARELFTMLPEINYGHPTLVEDDNVLVFSSNNPAGYGEYDLYYSVREEGGWSEPDLMPESINTIGNEKFPRSEGDTLYFSSDYLPGLGGLDIFKTYLGADGKWSVPENLKAPINSGSDDFSLVIDRSDNQSARNTVTLAGYFSSSRAGTGSDDIYKFSKYQLDEPEKEDVAAEEEPEEDLSNLDEKKAIFLSIRVVTKDYADEQDPNSGIVGKTALPNTPVKIQTESGVKTLNTDSNGRIVIDAEYATSYKISAGKEGFLSGSRDFISPKKADLSGSETYNIEVALDKIFYNKEIVLQDIFYDLNKWFIRDDAKPSLDSLSILMTDNPDISILLASHTDCRGRPEFNMELSDRRAQSAVEYLRTKGISDSRLAYKGYGESKLQIDCVCTLCTEEQHQSNRRTTFTILLE